VKIVTSHSRQYLRVALLKSRYVILHSIKFVATQQTRSEPSLATTRSEAYCKNGFTRRALMMSMSYDARLLRNGTSWTSA